jgi:putative protein kinase ArgK-like GTPase of G3E family
MLWIGLRKKRPCSSFGTNHPGHALLLKSEAAMAVNKPVGDNARKGAVKKRTQLKNALTKTSTKRHKKGGQFMAVKKSAKKFKGVRKEK